jgi:hypothetical protein
MGDHHQATLKQAKGDEAGFLVVEPVVLEGQTRTGEHRSCIVEAQAMLGKVLLTLLVTPLEHVPYLQVQLRL